MTDRELLELAAKATGRRIAGWNEQHGVDVAVLDDGTFWQPLLKNNITDCMGDALRLLAAMPSLWGLSLKFGAPSIEMDVAWGFGSIVCVEYAGKDVDLASAMRAAIVRAAAEIGMAMK